MKAEFKIKCNNRDKAMIEFYSGDMRYFAGVIHEDMVFLGSPNSTEKKRIMDMLLDGETLDAEFTIKLE